ncbi:regulatory protein RecX [Terriglobus tenax]|uniref:regulatory protein RecX n=1 Tax=Terriglobus tenax TaxID=1111115 RepID=UPI0021E06073|nr:regulatory protein RecX [Terriglobus tenax]
MPFRKPKPREPLTETELLDYAAGALGRRMLTVSELRKRLKMRVEDNAEGEAKITRVIARLEEMKYLSDPRFAADFTRLRQENQAFGKRRIANDLRNKGVAQPLIESTLTTAFEDVKELDLAREHLRKKRLKPPTNEKEAARIVRRLATAGFSMGTIFAALKELKASDEVLSEVESIQEVEE